MGKKKDLLVELFNLDRRQTQLRQAIDASSPLDDDLAGFAREFEKNLERIRAINDELGSVPA